MIKALSEAAFVSIPRRTPAQPPEPTFTVYWRETEISTACYQEVTLEELMDLARNHSTAIPIATRDGSGGWHFSILMGGEE